MIAKKKPKLTERRAPERPKIPIAALFRMFVIGSIAIVASVYAIWRHYTVPVRKMLEPVPSATEIEIQVEPPP